MLENFCKYIQKANFYIKQEEICIRRDFSFAFSMWSSLPPLCNSSSTLFNDQVQLVLSEWWILYFLTVFLTRSQSIQRTAKSYSSTEFLFFPKSKCCLFHRAETYRVGKISSPTWSLRVMVNRATSAFTPWLPEESEDSRFWDINSDGSSHV